MGKMDSLMVWAGLKPAPRVEVHPPEDVRVTINGVGVHVVVLQNQASPTLYTAYGPTELGIFDDPPTVWVGRQHPDTTVRVAILRRTDGFYEFAPLPAVVMRPLPAGGPR